MAPCGLWRDSQTSTKRPGYISITENITCLILIITTTEKNITGMCYAISDSPLGPWEYKGIYMEPTDSYTNHGSIVEFKGQWYSFYHNSALSGHDWLRSICVDKLYYNPDGTIKMVKQTK